jgi:hypothetical protein
VVSRQCFEAEFPVRSHLSNAIHEHHPTSAEGLFGLTVTKETFLMNVAQANQTVNSGSAADRRMLTNGLTLIALGLSILFLNSWDSLFVRASIGLFWGTFFLIINGPDAVRVFQRLRQKNDRQRRSGYRSST